MELLRKFNFGSLNFSSIFMITCPYSILIYFSIDGISDFSSNLDQNRKFEILKSGPKSGHVIINIVENLSGPKSIRTQAILFLKSMSERGGSDIERPWLGMTIDFESICRNLSFKFSVIVCRIRLFPSLISEINWLGSELPLIHGCLVRDQ